jgi:flagellar secretion chaperone FliS
VGLETGVSEASPHQLITMLFDGAIKASNDAIMFINHQNIAGRGQALSKAIRIVDEGLKGALDLQVGGGLAQQLKELYDYMVLRYLQANLHGKVEPITEVIGLLTEIRSAWIEMGQVQSVTTSLSVDAVIAA